VPLISTSIPNLINGVSQQPAAIRLSSQADYQKNALSSVVEGLRKRPPTQHVAKLSSGTLGNAYIHLINRDITERYIVVVLNEGIRVFDLEGNEKTVSFPEGTSYLAASSPQTAFRAITIADYTFITNTTKTVSMDASSAPEDRGVEAIVFIQQVNYSTDYAVTVDGYTASTSTGSSGTISTSTIADSLKTSLEGLVPDIEIEREGPVLWIRKSDGSDFEIKTEDSRSNTQMYLAKDTVQRFSELPTIAPRDFTVEVVGDNTSSFDNYFVKFVPNNDSADFDTGTWNETVKPGLATEFDASTMPHALIRMADGTFEFRSLDWGPRRVGDEDSAPEPTFVGRKISDMFFYKNRLGFLSDENVSMSAAGEFFEFFPRTVTTVVDSDPVDVAASHVKVSILRHAVPFNERLLLFSDQTQFVLESDSILASEPPDVQVLTEFESSLRAKPVGAGRVVFFATQKGSYAGIREYYVMPDTDIEDAADITAHVPHYVPSNIFKLAVSSNEDILFVLSEDQRNRLYVYKYFWSGTEKLQSSWSFFELSESATILNVDFIDTDAYLVVEYPDGVYLERMAIEPGKTDEGAAFEFLLDRKLDQTKVIGTTYNTTSNTTTFTLPYQIYGEAQVVTSYGQPGSYAPGVVLQTVSQAGNTITVRGDHRTTPVFIGIKYEMRYRFSMAVLKEEAQGGGQATIGEGRLQIRYWSVLYDETGFFTAEVTPLARDTNIYTFTGRIIGSPNASIGDVPLESGTFRFPVLSRNDRVSIELANDTFLPCRFQSAEWEALFTLRSRRL
jgi:hypothetical protein